MKQQEHEVFLLVEKNEYYKNYCKQKDAVLEQFNEINESCIKPSNDDQKCIIDFVSIIVPSISEACDSRFPEIAEWYNNDVCSSLETTITEAKPIMPDDKKVALFVCEETSNFYAACANEFQNIGHFGIASAYNRLAIQYKMYFYKLEEKKTFLLKLLDDLLLSSQNIKKNNYCDTVSVCWILIKLFLEMGDSARAAQALNIAYNLRGKLKKENSQNFEEKNIDSKIDYEAAVLMTKKKREHLKLSIMKYGQAIENAIRHNNEDEIKKLTQVLSDVADFLRIQGILFSQKREYSYAKKLFLFSNDCLMQIPENYLTKDDEQCYLINYLQLINATLRGKKEEGNTEYLLGYYSNLEQYLEDQPLELLVEIRMQQKELLALSQGLVARRIKDFIFEVAVILKPKIFQKYPPEKMKEWLGEGFFSDRDNNAKKRKIAPPLEDNPYKKIKL